MSCEWALLEESFLRAVPAENWWEIASRRLDAVSVGSLTPLVDTSFGGRLTLATGKNRGVRHRDLDASKMMGL